jgi:hypothetical protein
MGETTVRVLFYHLRWVICVLAVANIFTIVGAVLFDDILFGVFEFAGSNSTIDATEFARDLLFWIGILAGTVAWHVRTTPQGYERRHTLGASTAARKSSTKVQVK